MVRGAPFKWLKPDVYPVIASVAIGVGFSLYHMSRHILYSPDVHLSKAHRMEGYPESGVLEQRSSGYNSGSIYRDLQGSRAEKTVEQGRTRIF